MSKQILTPESLFSLKNVTDVQMSPDGTQVVYLVEETDQETDKTKNSLWLRNLKEDAEPIRLTAHPSDSSPRWSPDGKRVAFISSREGSKAQLFVINAGGGEAEQVKTKHAPSSAPLWSPDGQHIAFKARVDLPTGERYPGEPTQLIPQAVKTDETEAKQDDAKKPAPVHVITDINFQADRRGLIYDKFTQLFVINLETGECQQMTTGAKRIEDFIWNTSGSALLYVVDRYCPTLAKHTAAIYQVDIANKATGHILNFAGSLNHINLAPGGRWLLLTGPDNKRPLGIGVARLWVIDLHSPSLPLDQADVHCLTPELDASCNHAKWDKNGESIYFVKPWHGATTLCQVFVTAGEAGKMIEHEITDLSMIALFDLAPDNSLVFVAHDFITPPELYLRRQNAVKQLTHLHADFLSKHEVCPAEKFTYQGADGWDIDGWLVRPLNYESGQRYPTVLSVHGGPTGAYSDSWQFPFQLLAHQGFAVVFTNPRGSVTYGEDFTHACVGDIGGKDYQEIMAGLDHAIGMGVVDPNRVGITGWSYGGYMTCWSVTQTNRFQAAVAGACISNWHDLYGCGDSHVYDEGLFGGPPFTKEEEHLACSPIRYVQNVKTPLLLLHGELDIRCHTSQSDQFFTALKRTGKEVVYVRYPDQYHGFRRPSYIVDRWTRTVGWFKYYLLGD